MKYIKMIGFYDDELRKLIQHLKNTGYDEEEIAHLEGALIGDNNER